MGRIITPKYRIELDYRTIGVNQFSNSPAEWKPKEYGKPTAENIDRYVRNLVDSFKIGGCNAHISHSLGYIPVPNSGKIINQKTGSIMAIWKAPMFMVI